MHFYLQAGPCGTHPSSYEHLIGNILLDLNTPSAVAFFILSTHLQLPPFESFLHPRAWNSNSKHLLFADLQKHRQYREHVITPLWPSGAIEPKFRGEANLEGAVVVSACRWHCAAVRLHSIHLPGTIQSSRVDPFRIEGSVVGWEYTCLDCDWEGVEVVQCNNGGAVVGEDVSDALQG
jgi:hypothetical protein